MNKKALILILIFVAIIIILWMGCSFITHQAEIVHGEIVKTHIEEVYKNGKIEKSNVYDLYYTIDGDSDSISSIIVKCYDKNGNLTEEKKLDTTSRGEWRVFLSQPANSATVTIEFDYGLLSEPFNISKVKEESEVLYKENPASTTKSNPHAYYDIVAKSYNSGAFYSGEEGDYYVYTYHSNVPYADNHIKINKYTGEVL